MYISVLSCSTLLCDSNTICGFEIGQFLSKIQLPEVDAQCAEVSLRKKFVSNLDPTCTVPPCSIRKMRPQEGPQILASSDVTAERRRRKKNQGRTVLVG